MIYTFNPILKSTIWGGDRIAAFKGESSTDPTIGESWEISGVKGNVSVVADGPDCGKTLRELLETRGESLIGKENYRRFGNEFPLLIKFIDARADLSIQVHPDDTLAQKRHNSKGKTEMWYIIDATDDAHLRSGLSKELNPETYVKAVEDNTICDYLKDYNVKPGDVFFLPAGRIHSIGAGCFITEIQQTSDITYRIYDFNRKDASGNTRQLHTELAKDAIDYTVLPDYRTEYKEESNKLTRLASCDYFTTDLVSLTADKTVALPSLDSFIIVICTEGKLTVKADGDTKTLSRGQTALISADTAVSSLTAGSQGGKAVISFIK